MNFELTEEQRLIQDTARRFAAEEIAPTLEAEEAKHEFRADRVAKMGELGFFSCARAGGTGRQRHGLHGVGADGRADRQGIGVLAAAVQHAEPGPGADREQVRHRGAEEEIRARLGGRHAARLFRHDRAQHRLRRREHEDPRHRQAATTGKCTATRCGSRRRTSATPGCSTPTPTATKGNKGITAFIIEPKNMERLHRARRSRPSSA